MEVPLVFPRRRSSGTTGQRWKSLCRKSEWAKKVTVMGRGLDRAGGLGYLQTKRRIMALASGNADSLATAVSWWEPEDLRAEAPQALPGSLFAGAEQGSLLEQRANAVQAGLGRRMQPTKATDPAITLWEQMLHKAPDKFVRMEFDGQQLAGGIVLVGPWHAAIRQKAQRTIGRGGFEDVGGDTCPQTL